MRHTRTDLRRRVRVLAGAALLASAWLALVAPAPAALAQEGAVVMLGGYTLHPREVAVRVGEPVTFQVQADEAAMASHRVRALEGAFRSPPLGPGETWSVTFEEPGVYRYRLEERPSVEGTIVAH